MTSSLAIVRLSVLCQEVSAKILRSVFLLQDATSAGALRVLFGSRVFVTCSNSGKPNSITGRWQLVSNYFHRQKWTIAQARTTSGGISVHDPQGSIMRNFPPPHLPQYVQCGPRLGAHHQHFPEL